MTTRSLALPSLGIAAIAAIALATGTTSTAASHPGPFTAAQATAGSKSYGDNCSRCHGAALQGVSAPALRGPGSGLAGDSVGDAFTFISTQMPAGDPGSLTQAEYVNILSFILSKNGHAPGSVKLTPALAKASKVKV